MHLEIHGFQILNNAILDPKGITFIVGNTNNGKSSVCRALVTALYDNNGTDFINKSVGFARVHMVFDAEEGRKPCTITWQKSLDNKYSYAIDGSDLTKTGRKGPVDILSERGISSFKVRKEEVLIYYWRQLSEPLVVCESPTYAFEFISTIMEDKKIIPILKRAISDNREIKETITMLEGAIIAHGQQFSVQKEQYDGMSGLIELEPSFNEIRNLRVSVEKLGNIENELISLTSYIEQSDSFIQSTNRIRDEYSELPKIGKDIQLLTTLKSTLKSILDEEIEISEISEAVQLLDGLTKDLSKGLNFDIDTYNKLNNVSIELTNLDNQLNNLNSVISLTTDKLSHASSEYEQFKKTMKMCPLCNRPWGNNGK
jgi:DNA repair exonuclease SbcCD ATPase subunit